MCNRSCKSGKKYVFFLLENDISIRDSVERGNFFNKVSCSLILPTGESFPACFEFLCISKDLPLLRISSSVINNIDACKELSRVARAALGPHGSSKNKLFLTEFEIQHPAALLLVLAGKQQLKKFGDGANLVVSIAGKNLEGAKELITMGLSPSEIINGYRKASNKVCEILQGLVEEGSETMDVRDTDEVILRMNAPVASNQYWDDDILCPLIAEACIQVCPENPLNFNVDNVRVGRLLGVHTCFSKTFRGMVLKDDTIVGSIKRIDKAKVVVIAHGVNTEEAKVEELIKAVAESGAEVIVSGVAVREVALHFCEHYKIMVLHIDSESELDCFRRATNAFDLLKLGSTVDPCYIGYVDSIKFEKSHGTRVTVTNEKGGVSTVLLGGSTLIKSDKQMKLRTVDKGVDTYKELCKDSRIVPGAGATEIEIAIKLKEYSLTETGTDKHAIAKYAESFELIPKTLVKNAYLDEEIISTLYEEHTSGNVKVGIDSKGGGCKDVSTLKLWDLYTTKYHALQYAADAVCSINHWNV